MCAQAAAQSSEAQGSSSPDGQPPGNVVRPREDSVSSSVSKQSYSEELDPKTINEITDVQALSTLAPVPEAPIPAAVLGRSPAKEEANAEIPGSDSLTLSDPNSAASAVEAISTELLQVLFGTHHRMGNQSVVLRVPTRLPSHSLAVPPPVAAEQQNGIVTCQELIEFLDAVLH